MSGAAHTDGAQVSGELSESRTTYFAQRPLGEIMVHTGLLSVRQRDRVLARQRRHGGSFGASARRLRLIGARDLEMALACQFGFLHGLVPAARFSPELALVYRPFGGYAEQLRSMALRLGAGGPPAAQRALAVVSPGRGEGRTHTAANLALAFAQAGLRTLLIDLDLRRGRQHRLFRVSAHPGVSRLLAGQLPEQMAHRFDELGNLTLLTAGPRPPNPLELLGREALPGLLQRALAVYDRVVLDTPASARYPDAAVIARAAGSALLVSARRRSRHRAVEQLLQRLRDDGVTLAGALLNTPRFGPIVRRARS